MFINLFFNGKDLLEAEVSSCIPLHDGSGAYPDWRTKAGRFTAVEGEPDVWRCGFEAAHRVVPWLEAFRLVPIRVEIEETAYLDDQALKPPRG
ncbi:MAG: hypothetical protein QME74_06705 [Candidatus Edwardsbacteria bacterium]|nr:hypothetical protein [Candidatus Edwardsbacteria bacterium]